jgi:hypothetical protein
VQVAFFRRDGSGAKTIRAFSNYIRGERVKGVNRLLETNSSGGKDRRQELVCLARASLPSAGRPGESTQKKKRGLVQQRLFWIPAFAGMTAVQLGEKSSCRRYLCSATDF